MTVDKEQTTDPTPTVPLWPALRVADWMATRDTLQLWLQIIGKVQLAHAPLVNHWWNVTQHVTARGLTTGLLWTDNGHGFEIDVDFVDHELTVAMADGRLRKMALEPRSVADFYDELITHLDELGIASDIWTMPVEIEGAIPFDRDHEHASYDADHARRFWQTLVSSVRVIERFRTTFVGKSSPVHLFWGALDLAHTRFSGRSAPPHPGGAPHTGPRVMHEAYSHELSSWGYWPGGGVEGAYYAYAYPEPDGYRDVPVTPEQATYSEELGEFVLPYEAVRTSENPDATLFGFLETTYGAAADLAGWDRETLERPVPNWAPDRIAHTGPLPLAEQGGV